MTFRNDHRDTANWHYDTKEALRLLYDQELDTVVRRYIDAVVNCFVPKSVIENVKCKTLLLYGEMDKMAPKEHGTYFLRTIKSSKLHLFKDLSQNFHQENPEEFNKMIENFVLDQEYIIN